MRERLLLGPVLVLGVIGTVWLDQRLEHTPLPVGSAIGAVIALLLWFAAAELGVVFRAKDVQATTAQLRLCAYAGLGVSAVEPAIVGGRTGGVIIATAGVAVVALTMLWHARLRSPSGVTLACAASVMSFVYLGLMFGFALAIRREHSAWVLLWVVLVVKACDVGAYFTGRAVGRHKLIVWLSPGKTWEGLFGGAAFAALVAWLGCQLLARWTGAAPMGTLGAIGFGIAAAVIGQCGDLMASFLKRDALIKDSGNVLPGFGGVLDIIDSPLLTLPVAYWWLRYTTG